MKTAELFKNGMVVQAGKPFRVFGYGEGKAKITWLGQTEEVYSNGEDWCVEFPPAEYGGPYTLTVEFPEEKIDITDVMVGEVLLVAGQSNIAYRMCGESTPRSEYVDDPLLRIFMCDYPGETMEVSPIDGWVYAKIDNIGNWSALSYLIGREMRAGGCGCAVGVIVCTRGAATIQTFMPRESIVGTPLDLPREVLFPDHNLPFNKYGHLYDVMLSKLFPYSISKVIWYQGESNVSSAEADIYDKLLTAFINVCREKFRDPSLPFVVVQIAFFLDYFRLGWARLQEQQLKIQSLLPNVYSVVCEDICEKDDIHPRTKWRLAKRIYNDIFPKIGK